MESKKRDFDKVAAAWDENPERVKLASDIAGAITRQIKLKSDMDAADFGCGTGLLTFKLHPFVRSITGIDSSPKMLEVFKKKAANFSNVKSILVDFDKGDTLAGNYDLIVSNMTLHHIKEPHWLIERLRQHLKLGCYLCLSDLDLEGGQFHGDNTGVFHFGFERDKICNVFMEAGFDDIRITTGAEMVKPAASGEMRRFSVFLMTGRKV